jgi:hypothetical protein
MNAIHPLAMLAALVAAFVFGFLWYGPLLGKTWGGYMKMDMTKKPDGKFMAKALGLQVLGLLFTVLVCTYWLQVLKMQAGTMGSPAGYAFLTGASAWLGFKVPLQLGKITWEGRPWQIFVINSTYDFLHLQLIAHILAQLG